MSQVYRLQAAARLLERRLFAEARAECEHVIGAEPRNADAWNLLGLIEYQSGDTRAAQAALEQAVAAKPGYANAWQNLAAVRAAHGDHKGAIAAEQRLLEFSTNALPDDWYNLGVRAFRQGLAHLAADCFEQCLARAPTHREALNNLAVAYDAARQFHEARNAAARLLTLAPEADPLLRLGALLRPPPADPGLIGSVARRWRLANRDAARLEAIAGTALPALEAPGPERRRELYRLGPALYADLIRLVSAEVGEKAAQALAAALAEADLWRSPKLPLDGDDLLAEGLRPGPQLGKVLAAVETWWLERDFAPDRAACLAYARTLIAAPTTAAGALILKLANRYGTANGTRALKKV